MCDDIVRNMDALQSATFNSEVLSDTRGDVLDGLLLA